MYSKIKTMLWNAEKERVFYRLESNKLFVAAADELQPRKEELIKKCNMTLKIELEIEVTGDCSFEEAEDFFLYAFAGYSLPDWKNNPFINEDSDTEYDVTNIKIEEV